MIEHQAVQVFWNNNKLVNTEYLRDCLDEGWIVVKSDLLRDEDYPDTIIYILEKEIKDNVKQNTCSYAGYSDNRSFYRAIRIATLCDTDGRLRL